MELNVNSENFKEEILDFKGIALVDFYADWCGPCKMMGPIIEEIANETKEYAKVKKINVDENTDIAIDYNVMSIPTLIIFKEGKEQKRFIGVTDKEEILNEMK